MADQDARETAEVTQIQANTILTKANTIRQLSDAGYDRASVVEAVQAGDLSKLTVH